MSDDNNNSDNFDFDFNALNEDEPQGQSESSFDLDNPFGDDWAVTGSAPEASTDSPILDDSFHDLTDSGASGSVEKSMPEEHSAGNESEIGEEEVPPIAAEEEQAGKQKKGFLGGLFGGKKDKKPKKAVIKEKAPKEKQPKAKKEKVAKVPKEKDATDKQVVPRDWGTILCVVFTLFLLVSFLMVNIGGFLSAGDSIMQTLCFLGAINIVGAPLVAVPILFYKFPRERTLPNVLLGLSVGAMFTGVLFLVNNFYQYYGFALSP